MSSKLGSLDVGKQYTFPFSNTEQYYRKETVMYGYTTQDEKE
jgi:hypothetical protein